MEKMVIIKLKDSDTEEEFQEMLLRMGKIGEEYIETCQEQIAEMFERNTSSKIQSVDVKIIDTSERKKTRILMINGLRPTARMENNYGKYVY